jgi:hypothetical protein
LLLLLSLLLKLLLALQMLVVLVTCDAATDCPKYAVIRHVTGNGTSHSTREATDRMC